MTCTGKLHSTPQSQAPPRTQLAAAGAVPKAAVAAAAAGTAAAAALLPARAGGALSAAHGAGARAWGAWNCALALLGAGMLGQARLWILETIV